MKNVKAPVRTPRVQYTVLAQALSNAALSRRAALQVELAVGLVHFDQEDDGVSQASKARLKETYASAGYFCMAKADRDYKTVNRRLNACAALYEKLTSKTVSAWVQSCVGDTEALLAYVVTELQPYGLETMDDVLHFVGMDSSKSRGARLPKGPKNETQAGEGEGEGEGEGAGEGAMPAKLDLNLLTINLLNQFGAEELNQFAANLLEKVAAMEAAMVKLAA